MNLNIEHILMTKRGIRCIVIEKYRYSESNKLQNGTFRFRCTNKKCNVSVLISNNLKQILEMTTQSHNHDPSTKRSLAVDIVRSSSKKKAIENTHENPKTIIRKTLLVDNSGLQNEINHSDIDLIRRSIYRSRKQLYPVIPKSQKESINQLYNIQSTIKYKNQQFCFINEQKSIIIITCSDNLQLLCKSQHVFGDGTFLYCPKYFCQLYTLHVYIHNYYVPVAYVFLTSKSINNYLIMWFEIWKLCNELIGETLHVNIFHSDFEKAAHLATMQIFPNCQLITCTFHLNQIWYRKIVKHKKLLKAYLNEDSEVGLWLKYFFGLSFLPPAEVGDAFTELLSIMPTENECIYFADYVLDTYIDENAEFPPDLWASAPIFDHLRTINGPELFHSHFNNQFYSTRPHVHQVIAVLLEIQIKNKIIINSILKHIPNVLQKETTVKIEFIQETWNKYKRGEIDQLQYIKILGLKYQANKIL